METHIVDRFATSQQWADAESAIEVGAHLVSDREGYTHHGIYAGNGLVIHYGGFHRSSDRRPVEYIELRRFSAGKGVKVQGEPEALYRGFEAVERAKSRLGEDRYRLLTNNCEHFCAWCLRGTSRSEQVRRCVKDPLAGVKTLLVLSRGRLSFHRRGGKPGWSSFAWLHGILDCRRFFVIARAAA